FEIVGGHRPPLQLILFLLVQTGGEIIDFDVVCKIVFVISAKDLAGELFFQSFLTAFRFEPLHAVSCRFRVRSKVFARRPIPLDTAWIGKIRRAHGWTKWSGTGRPEAAWARGPWSCFFGAGLVNRQWPSFERLIIELANCFLGLLLVSKFHERKPPL